MATRTIAILANSIRAGNRCIAGKEVARQGQFWVPGKWIRLADPTTKEGEVPLHRARCSNGGLAEVLDIVELQIGEHCGNANHPEDWFLSPDEPWRRVDRLKFDDLAQFADSPPALWHAAARTRSVPAGYPARMSNPASLYVIKATGQWGIEYWKEHAPDFNTAGRMVEKTRRRLTLWYAGNQHEFDITDPAFTSKYRIFDAAEMDRRKSVELVNRMNTFLCLSLTPEWQGEHYKIAATIIERDA